MGLMADTVIGPTRCQEEFYQYSNILLAVSAGMSEAN
jgi:hypothetical protein